MEIILDELEQFTTETINDIGIYYQYNLDFINKKFLNIIYDNKNNIKFIQLFEYDQGKIQNIIYEKKKNLEDTYKTYLFEHNFNFDTIFTIIKNIQKNQLANTLNKFRKIQIINCGTIIIIINKYEINNYHELNTKYNVLTIYI
jgi:DNA-directed RNA polymerase beta' subunit